MTDSNEFAKSCPADLPPLKIRISLFYDGTLNNAPNVRANTPERGGSYANDLTNISRLYDALEENSPEHDHHIKIYTEGPGTKTGGRGDGWFRGKALGTGPIGVIPKGLDGWTSAMAEMFQQGISIDRKLKIDVDVFGFSRGAAAARFMVHYLLVNTYWRDQQMSRAGYTKLESIACKYVGLFDTVAAYGVNHDNDTQELHLDAVSHAQVGLQICAGDEHRANFRLTDTASNAAITDAYIPGVHSDIGGGYIEGYNEVDLNVYAPDVPSLPETRRQAIERQVTWLTERGWYSDDDLTFGFPYGKLTATRRNIPKCYTYIPMNMMAQHSTRDGAFVYSDKQLARYKIDDDLNDIKDVCYGYIDAPPGQNFWIDNKAEDLRNIRHKYLHFSAHYDDAFEPHAPDWTNAGKAGGMRERTVQGG